MCTTSQSFNPATPCMQYFNTIDSLVAKFLFFLLCSMTLQNLKMGHFWVILDQTDEGY